MSANGIFLLRETHGVRPIRTRVQNTTVKTIKKKGKTNKGRNSVPSISFTTIRGPPLEKRDVSMVATLDR